MIPGLSLQNDWLPATQQAALLTFIQQQLNSLPTTTDGSKGRSRILRYGYNYDPPHTWLRSVPTELSSLLPSNAVTINEYEPGHGIAPHKDSPAFPAPIHILSLNSSAIIQLSRKAITQQITLHPGSLLSLSNDALTKWFHATLPVFTPKTRYSVVFRNLPT